VFETPNVGTFEARDRVGPGLGLFAVARHSQKQVRLAGPHGLQIQVDDLKYMTNVNCISAVDSKTTEPLRGQFFKALQQTIPWADR